MLVLVGNPEDRFSHNVAQIFQAFAGTTPAHDWTKALCQADSDGDGRTNGEELGDPNCNWRPGATPSRAATGHPGICEPLGSARCANEVYYCGCKGPNC